MNSTGIIQVGNNSFVLAIRGATMALNKDDDGYWRMRTDNAAARAWNRGMTSLRTFRSLEEVEKHYKSWRGIATLAAL